jgi:hypothetical protein
MRAVGDALHAVQSKDEPHAQRRINAENLCRKMCGIGRRQPESAIATHPDIEASKLGIAD